MKLQARFIALGLAVAIFAAACTGSSSGASAAASCDEDTGSTLDNPAPTGAFVMFDGSEATFTDYAGTPLVVNWWASWCPSCVAEMSAAFRPAQEQLGAQVAFLGMNLQDEREDALRLVTATGVLFDLAEDPAGDLYLELGGLGMPFTIFIDAEGNVVEKHNGPLTEGQLIEMIDELLLS